MRRDPWLLSQTLMQILYLLPPALLLWHSFDGGVSVLLVMVPVLVMASGQLAGGLAGPGPQDQGLDARRLGLQHGVDVGDRLRRRADLE